MELEIPAGGATGLLKESERDMVERARCDRQAFAELYRRHQAVIGGYIFRRTGDAHATEDLVADVFLTALRYLPRFRHRGVPVRAWLYRIATNAVNRWVRRERRRRRLDADSSRDRIATSSTGGGSTLDAPADQARAALLSLPPKYQTVLSLHYLEGMVLEEVATTIGCRLGTVKSRLSRGRAALRAKLTGGRQNS